MHQLPTLLRECAAKLSEAAALLDNALGTIVGNDPQVNKILRAVCDSWHVGLIELLGKGKSKRLAEARFAAFRIMQTQCPKLSLTATAQLLGRTDHGTVLNGRRQADRWLETDPQFRAKFERAQASVPSSKA